MTRDGNYLRDSEFINSETMELSYTKVTSGGIQDLCSDTCDSKGSEFSGVYELEHQSGSKFGKFGRKSTRSQIRFPMSLRV